MMSTGNIIVFWGNDQTKIYQIQFHHALATKEQVNELKTIKKNGSIYVPW